MLSTQLCRPRKKPHSWYRQRRREAAFFTALLTIWQMDGGLHRPFAFGLYPDFRRSVYARHAGLHASDGPCGHRVDWVD